MSARVLISRNALGLMQEQELEAERHECEALCDKVNLEWYSS